MDFKCDELILGKKDADSRALTDYYRVLEQTQKGSLDITAWLVWFLDTLNATLEQAQQAITRTLAKSRFWQQHGSEPLSAEQIKGKRP